MKIYKKLLLIILTIVLLFSCTPLKKFRTVTQGSVDKKNFVEEIPFDYYNGLIFIELEISKKKYKFIFDTGADITVLNENLLKEVNYKSKKVGNTITDSNGTKKYSEYIQLENIKLGKINFLNTGATIMNLSHFKKTFGCIEFDGIVGSNLMRKAKWQINYTKKTISFTDNFKNLNLSGKTIVFDMNSGSYGPFELDLNLNGIAEKFTFDTGSNRDISANKALFDKINANTTLDYTVMNGLKGSSAFNNKASGLQYYAMIPKLTSSVNEFKKKIVIFSDNSSNLIGNVFLENYIVTINWSAEKAYLDPINELKFDTLNVFELLIGPNYNNNSLQVYNSWEDHKSKYQIEIGTKITALNNIDVSSFNTLQLCEFWTNKRKEILDKQTIEIEFQDKAGIQKAILTKKQLLPKLLH